MIEETNEHPDPELDDERRRYYGLTDFGRRVLVAEAARIAQLPSIAVRRLLSATCHHRRVLVADRHRDDGTES
jgi:hypothetical protein